MFTLLFDPALARPFVVDWPALAGRMLARLHRECLRSRGDARLSALLDRTLRFPGVRPEWRQPSFASPVPSTLQVCLSREGLNIGFMTTLTAFSAPGMVTLEETRIESYFPIDEATRAACHAMAAGASPGAR
jgi:MmyB-like transcription regulator ligand binding domain